jgi:hypothetical protein
MRLKRLPQRRAARASRSGAERARGEGQGRGGASPVPRVCFYLAFFYPRGARGEPEARTKTTPVLGQNHAGVETTDLNPKSQALACLTYWGGWRWRRFAFACFDAETRFLTTGALASTTYNNFIADLLFLSAASRVPACAVARWGALRTSLFGICFGKWALMPITHNAGQLPTASPTSWCY